MNNNLYNDIVTYIEKTNNTKLCGYQKIFLKAVLDNKTVSMPIHSGRNMLINGICDFLRNKHRDHISYIEADVHITLEDVMKENVELRNKYNKIIDHLNNNKMEVI